MEENYKDDIRDLLASLEACLLQLEEEPSKTDLLEQIFRDLHTIKGAAYMFDLQDLGDFVHELENIFDDLRSNKYLADIDIIQVTFESLDFIREGLEYKNFQEQGLENKKRVILEKLQFVKAEAKKSSESPVEDSFKNSLYLLDLKPKIELAQEDDHPVHFIMQDLKSSIFMEDVQLKNKKKRTVKKWTLIFLSDLAPAEIESQFLFIDDDFNITLESFRLNNFENIDSAFQEFKKLISELEGDELVKEITETIATYKTEIDDLETQKNEVENSKSSTESYIKVSRSKIDDLMSWVSELITMQATLKNEADKFESETLYRVSENMEFITENLRETIFSVSLVPIKNLETRFKRLIRELSNTLKMEADFILEGTDTELDKKIIETLSDPLLHIIRNCFGHGIESAEERENQGKSAKGLIKINSYYSGNHVIIEISDDGRGIDIEKIKSKAIKKEIIGKDSILTEEELTQLIFHPGFSTADTINDVSGRGVGMDVVRKKIQEMRGEVLVHSIKGEGTTFTIKIPLSLSVIDGLLTKVGNTHFVLPLNTVREIHRIEKEHFEKLPEGSNIIEIDGKQMPVISLEAAFGLLNNETKTSDVITVDVGLSKKGVAVDEIKGQIKAVLKPLSEYYKDQDFISGGTILGDGSLALILDMDRLIQDN